MTDRVKQRGLTVVNVAHYAHNGCAGLQILGMLLGLAEQLFFNGNNDFLRYLGAELVGDQVCGVVIDDLVDGGHHTVHHHLLDDLGGGLLQAGRQFPYGDLVGQSDLQGHLLQLLQILLAKLLHSQTLLVTVLGGTHVAGVLLLQLLLVGGGVGECVGRELIQTLVVLGQIHVGGTGIDHAGVAGSLLFHHGLLRLLGLRRTGGLEGGIVGGSAGIRALSLLSVLIGTESTLLSLLEAVARAAVLLLEAIIRTTVLLESVTRALSLLSVLIGSESTLLSLLEAIVRAAVLLLETIIRALSLGLSRRRLCLCLGSLRLGSFHLRLCLLLLGFGRVSLDLRLHGGLHFLFLGLGCFLHGSLGLLFFLDFGLLLLHDFRSFRLLFFRLLAADPGLTAQVAVQILDLILPGQLVKEHVEFIRLKRGHIRLHADAGALHLRENLLIFHSQVFRQLIDLEHRCLCHPFSYPARAGGPFLDRVLRDFRCVIQITDNRRVSGSLWQIRRRARRRRIIPSYRTHGPIPPL